MKKGELGARLKDLAKFHEILPRNHLVAIALALDAGVGV
jgi:hypothetical protein